MNPNFDDLPPSGHEILPGQRSHHFDWEELYERLGEDASEAGNDPRLAETVTRLLQFFVPDTSRRIAPESVGLRLLALAWLLSPAYFDGCPSLRRLAERCGVRAATLARYTGHYSRLIGWRNHGQRHAWNWRRKGRPDGVTRNVPDKGKSAC